ncbi:hypothetical protein SAMN05428961_105193 [Paenibacillus sp. OK060]|nr:hypothetical protein SAMN05428961_105193 [Paenibacillus sp. OK060]
MLISYYIQYKTSEKKRKKAHIILLNRTRYVSFYDLPKIILIISLSPKLLSSSFVIRLRVRLTNSLLVILS